MAILTPTNMTTLANETHTIDLTTAQNQTRAFRDTGNQKHGGIFNKQVVLNILNRAECVGLRYYFGITNDNNVLLPDSNVRAERNPTIILCGIDRNGNDMLDRLAEQSWACPPHCSPANVLNSDQNPD